MRKAIVSALAFLSVYSCAHAAVVDAASFLTELETKSGDFETYVWTAAGVGLGVFAGLIAIVLIRRGFSALTGRS